MEANSTVNLVPFGLTITELQMRENQDFARRLLTPFKRAPFSLAAQQITYTVCLDNDHNTF